MKVDVVVKFQCVGCRRALLSLIRDAEVPIADPKAEHPCFACGGEFRFIGGAEFVAMPGPARRTT